MILGIAGKACSGKNAAAAIFVAKGYESVDVDTLGHKALLLKKDDIVQAFGIHILNTEGEIDRKVLGSLVFKDKPALKKLESMTHPAVFSMVEEFIRSSESENIIINAAILGTSGMDVLCDRVLWIDSPLLLRILRAINRDRNRISAIFSRIRSQRDLTIQHFSADVDIYMVRNRGKLGELEKQIDLFLSFPDNYKRV